MPEYRFATLLDNTFKAFRRFIGPIYRMFNQVHNIIEILEI